MKAEWTQHPTDALSVVTLSETSEGLPIAPVPVVWNIAIDVSGSMHKSLRFLRECLAQLAQTSHDDTIQNVYTFDERFQVFLENCHRDKFILSLHSLRAEENRTNLELCLQKILSVHETRLKNLQNCTTPRICSSKVMMDTIHHWLLITDGWPTAGLRDLSDKSPMNHLVTLMAKSQIFLHTIALDSESSLPLEFLMYLSRSCGGVHHTVSPLKTQSLQAFIDVSMQPSISILRISSVQIVTETSSQSTSQPSSQPNVYHFFGHSLNRDVDVLQTLRLNEPLQFAFNGPSALQTLGKNAFLKVTDLAGNSKKIPITKISLDMTQNIDLQRLLFEMLKHREMFSSMQEELNQMQAQPLNLEDWPDWWLNETTRQLRDIIDDSKSSKNVKDTVEQILSIAPSVYESHQKLSKSHALLIQRPLLEDCLQTLKDWL